MKPIHNFVDDYLNDFEILKKYDHVYVTENLLNLNKIKLKKNSIILYLPSQRDFYKKTTFENLELKKISISRIFNKKPLERWKIDYDSINFVERNFKDLKKKNHFYFNFIFKYLDSHTGSCYIKSHLLHSVKKFFTYLQINKILKEYNENITFCLKDFDSKFYWELYVKKKKKLKEININFIDDSYDFIKNISTSLKIFIFPVFSIFKARNFLSKNNFLSKIYIRQYKDGIGINRFPNSSEDWILDKNNIKKVVFVLEEPPTKNQLNNLSKYNFIHANSRTPIHTLKIENIYKIIFKFFFPYIFFSISSLFLRGIIKKIFKEFLIDYFIWDNFFVDKENIKYLTCHNHQPSHIIRNFFIEKKKSKSFNYKHTFSENVFNKDIGKFYSILYYFSFFNYEFHMSEASTFINICKSLKRKKINLISGPIWSSKKFDNLKLGFPSNKIIISFFASTYSYAGVNMFEDHYNIFRFLDKISKIPNIFIVFKGKGDFSNYCKDKRIHKIYLKLKKKNKILIVKKYTAARYVINRSNLIISMPFSTPSFEALYLKKPCFFLDISNSYKNSYVDSKTKNFVAHSFSDGERLLKSYLNDKKFNQKFTSYNFNKIFKNENLNKQDPIDFIKEKIF